MRHPVPPQPAEPEPLGERFERALVYATAAHRGQSRKGGSVPYVAHLLAVCALVLEDGGDEDQAIAALLHDVVEDQGGLVRLADVRAQFGDAVAEVVLSCSDATGADPAAKPPWRDRKDAYLQHLATAPIAVLRVSAADKLHNVRTLVADVRTHGSQTMRRFAGGTEGTEWYYRRVHQILAASELGASPMVRELGMGITELSHQLEAPIVVKP